MLTFIYHSHELSFAQAKPPTSEAQKKTIVPAASAKLQNKTDITMHKAPIILKAYETHLAAGFSLDQYRVIANVNGEAKIIPFQIDEVAAYEDFVLPDGPTPNAEMSNGIFDRLDELSFMAEDVGLANAPEIWSFEKPTFLYRLDAKRNGAVYGSVFIGIYQERNSRPNLSKKRYVGFDIKNATVMTSRYKYTFDPTNYLVVKSIELNKKDGGTEKIVSSSSFFLRADLKYFLTFNIGHSDITSKLEAYKSGPIRSIVRVTFSYNFLRLEFEMGMYTEVSFFSNSVVLPAIMYNPLDGSKALNESSGFSYGFATTFDTSKIDIETNMDLVKEKSILSLFKSKKKILPYYSLVAKHPEFLMLMDITPSWKMINKGNRPLLYKENGDPAVISKRPWNKPLPLGKAPVNLGVFFDLSDLSEGEHRMSFKLYFENENNGDNIKQYSNLDRWYYTMSTEKVQ